MSFNRNTTTFAATKHVPWAPNTPNMRLRHGPGRKRIFGVFRAPENVLGGCKYRCPLLGEADGAFPNALAESMGPLRGGEKRGEREGKDWEKKETKKDVMNWRNILPNNFLAFSGCSLA